MGGYVDHTYFFLWQAKTGNKPVSYIRGFNACPDPVENLKRFLEECEDVIVRKGLGAPAEYRGARLRCGR